MKEFFDIVLDEHNLKYSAFNSFEDFMSFLELELAYDEDREQLSEDRDVIKEIYMENI